MHDLSWQVGAWYALTGFTSTVCARWSIKHFRQRNWALFVAWGLGCLGGLCNFAAIAANNNCMPVEDWRWPIPTRDQLHCLSNGQTHLWFLTDWLTWGDGFRFSVGDVCLYGAITVWFVASLVKIHRLSK